jgi:hypothetical protein
MPPTFILASGLPWAHLQWPIAFRRRSGEPADPRLIPVALMISTVSSLRHDEPLAIRYRCHAADAGQEIKYVVSIIFRLHTRGEPELCTVGPAMLSSCETAVTNCAGANGFRSRMLSGTPCDVHWSPLAPVM